ncbi:MAG TPA: 4Fe-4S binding protein, partial [Clostridia bacterium]|nr:4Fe-4S binding protein [Clostridia bacterium]
MAKAIIDETKCKGCGLCVAACPRKILVLSPDKINSKGYRPAQVVDQSK